MNQKINTILFDYDGTLTVSMSLFEKIGENGLTRFKKTINLDQKRQIMDCLFLNLNANSSRIGAIRAIKIYIKINQILNLSFIQSIFFSLYCFYQTKRLHLYVPIKSNTIEILEKIQSEHFKIGLVTMASINSLNKKQLILPYFQVIVTRENTRKSKPNPEGLVRALMSLKSNPNNSVYIGDLPIDIQAAKAIKMKSIIIKSSLVTEKMLMKFKPEKICSSLSEAVNWILNYNEKLNL